MDINLMLKNSSNLTHSETANHIDRVQKVTKKILEKMTKTETTITNEYRRKVVMMSALHDIGKSAISEKILYKQGPLDEDERAIVETHTLSGVYLLKRMREKAKLLRVKTNYEIAENIVLHHHEKWDGSGYPDGLKKEEIPFEARIVSVADVYDALTSERCYKQAWTREEALDFIQQKKGIHFDPQVVDALTSMKETL